MKNTILPLLFLFAFLPFTHAQESFKDVRDGQSYKIITIDKQTWFAQNLNFKTEEAYCYDENEQLCKKYGRLYQADDAKSACPQGWHLPSDEEWKILETALGMEKDETDETGWRGTEQGVKLKDTKLFAALLGGKMIPSGNFVGLDINGNFWTATNDANGYTFYRYVSSEQKMIGRLSLTGYAFSVRCIKD
jgi:uncharacterized protein (TIGR02145 family)